MKTFLSTIFGDAVCATHRIAVVRLSPFTAQHFASIDEAVEYAGSTRREVYFGAGLASLGYGRRNNRGDISGIGALWADVDMIAPYRRKKNLPKTLEEAREFIGELPLKPSMLVATGHGVHAWWVLKEPWIFLTSGERDAAEKITKGWHEYVCQRAATKKWHLENLGDLTRVMRLPETLNVKDPSDPIEVILLDQNNLRYDPEDFGQYATTTPKESSLPGLHLLADAEPPPEKFEKLLLQSRAFLETWERNRPDFADQSQSAYDLSLATIAALNEWTTQEIADLLIAARRKHGQKPEKALRESYVRRTVGKASAAAQEQLAALRDVDLAQFGEICDTVDDTVTDPGPIPDNLLSIPGFVNELMDYTMETGPYPNPILAFGGALALLAFVVGRKVRDPGDTRTNLYLLALGYSAAGKDHPRKVNARIATEVGLGENLGNRFASGEAVEDALFGTPCMLFQTDEFDGILQALNHSKDARHEGIMGTLLTMFSSSNSIFHVRRRADQQEGKYINQPHLVIFGTAIPKHYYEAISERMLTNGLFARMMVLECRQRPQGQEPVIRDIPARILSGARWWAEYNPGTGDLADWSPVPQIIDYTDEGRKTAIEMRMEADAHYAKAETAGDSIGTTIWGRANEQGRKLALIYAISAGMGKDAVIEITKDAVLWGRALSFHMIRRMLYMVRTNLAETPFQVNCRRILNFLRDSNGKMMHGLLLRRSGLLARDFVDILATLQQRHEVIVRTESRKHGPPAKVYELTQMPKTPAWKREHEKHLAEEYHRNTGRNGDE